MSGNGKDQEGRSGETPPAGDSTLKSYTEGQALTNRMGEIQNKIMVLSGKGGVGKKHRRGKYRRRPRYGREKSGPS